MTKGKITNQDLYHLKQTIDKLTKEVEEANKHIEDLNQLATDRGNEVHKLKEQLKKYENICICWDAEGCEKCMNN